MTKFQIGQIVQRYHDSGCEGAYPVFGKVVRVNRKTVTVRWEHGDTWRIEPQHIGVISGKFAKQIEREYLSDTASSRGADGGKAAE